MTPSVRSRRASTSRRSLVVVGLAVFVLVDIVLVGLALHGRSSANAEVLPSATPLRRP